MISIVDPHQHLWDLRNMRLSWLQQEGLEPLRRSFVWEDYLQAVTGWGVVQTVYMEVDVDERDRSIEAETVLRWWREGNPWLGGAVLSVRPASPELAADLRRYAAYPVVKGFRQVLHVAQTPPGYCLQTRFMEGVRELGQHGYSFDLCMRPGEWLDAARLVEACPQTQFIIDHCGNMPVQSRDETLRAAWQQGMKALAGLPNTVCKISGIVITAAEPWQPSDLADVIEPTIEWFGEERVMFASDWPVCTLRATFTQWLRAVQHLVASRSESFKRKLFGENARRVYRLPPVSA
ncbi:MAG: amidohydrolase [Planctomycetaceae bacterium]|nr:MAG: amidohydrolase [Planctomycetaceae bacterium]